MHMGWNANKVRPVSVLPGCPPPPWRELAPLTRTAPPGGRPTNAATATAAPAPPLLGGAVHRQLVGSSTPAPAPGPSQAAKRRFTPADAAHHAPRLPPATRQHTDGRGRRTIAPCPAAAACHAAAHRRAGPPQDSTPPAAARGPQHVAAKGAAAAAATAAATAVKRTQQPSCTPSTATAAPQGGNRLVASAQERRSSWPVCDVTINRPESRRARAAAKLPAAQTSA